MAQVCMQTSIVHQVTSKALQSNQATLRHDVQSRFRVEIQASDV